MHDDNKAALAHLTRVFQSGTRADRETCLKALFHPEAAIRLCAPFQRLAGPQALWGQAYAPLQAAMPDLERRDFILMAGTRWRGSGNWVGVGGNFVGTFKAPWLGIRPTGAPVFFRYHEFYRFEADRIVEMEAIWDIPQVMSQAGAWPLPPQKGVEWMCPGPADSSGIIHAPFDATAAERSVQLVWDMLHVLQTGDADTPERGLGGYWHKNALWYGPTGIGSARGHQGIRDTVLAGFRTGLSDNTRHLDEGVFFGDHAYVAFTGWPSGTALHSGEGFLGLAPTGRRFTRRSLDFWRIETGQIRENWVLVDMIDLLNQLGVDVLARVASQDTTSTAA